MPDRERARFNITDHLSHTWLHERVGFSIDFTPDEEQPYAILDEQDRRLPCQFLSPPDSPETEVWFYVEELPAGATRTYRLVEVDKAPVAASAGVHTVQQGKWMIAKTEYLAVRMGVGQNENGTYQAPLLGIRGGDAHWMGSGRFELSEHLEIIEMHAEPIEVGPLWQTWRIHYICKGDATYTMHIRIFAEEPYVEIHEESYLNRESKIIYNTEGLDPDHLWTHRHKLEGVGGHTGSLGAVQMPVYSGVWIPDDYYYAVLINERGDSPDSLAICGIEGSYWDYPYENQMEIVRTIETGAAGHDKGVITVEMSIKAGHRAWLLMLADDKQVITSKPPQDNPVHRAIKQYETPLHKVKDYTLTWHDSADDQRPFAIANRKQLAEAQRKAHTYPKFKEYLRSLNPDLPGDYTYYHSGTHRTFEDDHRNDPAVLYVTAESEEQRKKQAAFLKDVVLEGLAHRREAMLAGCGHTDQQSCSINLGRGLRPWAALYDFAAAEGVFSEQEKRLAQATFAFFAYKINDRDFWPAEALTLRDDHPRSAHRTHWFPGRHSDWSFYNIDNIPHNFHGDLWSALGCIAMTFPDHPQSEAWIEQTLEYWEAELTQWIFPEGAWLESSTYTLNSMKDYLIYCRMLKNSHLRNYFTDERLQRAFRFIADALGPYDTRIEGRSLPVMGDGNYPNTFAYVLGWMAGLASEDKNFAQYMSYAWKSTGEFLTQPGRFGLNFCDFLFIDPEIPAAEPPTLDSTWYQGMGAILRHAHGTPQEIWCFIKAGTIYSHFHEPEGTFQLWWNSAPLCDEYGIQYGYGSDGEGNDNISTAVPSCHNCIEIKDLESTPYNKGDITTFTATEAFDHVVVDAPILPPYLEEGQWIYGYKGEMAPAGWHRRHFLLVKPYFLYIYDDLEGPYPTIYHLNIKADSKQQHDHRVDYQGRLGTDLQVAFLNLGDRQLRHSEFHLGPRDKYGFQPPPEFHHQLQLHVDNQPYQDIASVLVPHHPDTPAQVEEDTTTRGARITIGDRTFHAMLFPTRTTVDTHTITFVGRAGVIETHGDTITLHLADGNRIGIPGRLELKGSGPFTATWTPQEGLCLTSEGPARWLTVTGVDLPKNDRVEHLSDGTQRLYIDAGRHCIRC